MRNIFKKMDADRVFMSNDIEIQVDANRIKSLTMAKVKSNDKNHLLKKITSIAASFLITVTLIGVTTYGWATPVLRNSIQEMLGLEGGEVLHVGESVSSRDYKMTVEDFVYDGIRGKATVSVAPLSNRAKEMFQQEELSTKFGHFSIANSLGELEASPEEDKRYFSFSFSKPVHVEPLSKMDSLVFAFEGIRDMIKIPLEPTLMSEQRDIYAVAQGDYPITYHSMIYSKLGFTLIGEEIDEEKDDSNITIDFILKDGKTIHFINRINHSYIPYKPEIQNNLEEQESHKETIIMDGKKTTVQVVKNETTVDNTRIEGIDFIDDEWFSGSGGSGYSADNRYMIETSFTFRKSFDWSHVEMIIINGTKVKIH